MKSSGTQKLNWPKCEEPAAASLAAVKLVVPKVIQSHPIEPSLARLFLKSLSALSTTAAG